MPRGDKSAYTDKQKRKAEHIEDGYKERGIPASKAAEIAWATVNKEDGGGKKSGSGRARMATRTAAKTGSKPADKHGGTTSIRSAAAKPVADRSAAAKKGWVTRRKHAQDHGHAAA